jgi:hypothetical protein
MAARPRGSAQLVEADMADMGFAPGRAMAAEDIRNLQSRRHPRLRSAGRRISLSLSAMCSSGLMTSLIVLLATRVWSAVVSSLA